MVLYLKSLVQNKYISFLVFFLLLIFDRLLILSEFNFLFVSNDEMIFWQAANDYSKGIFYEPYFYGQNYNFLLEALFSVPLIWCDVPFQYALPLTSAFMSLFPFILFSVVLLKRGLILESYAFLLIPLLLPAEYGMTTSMSRGFVSGLFFTGFFVYPLLMPLAKRSYAICGLIAALAYIFNPNSLVVSFPVCLYLLLVNYKNILFYVIFIVTAFPVLLLELFAKEFYARHPHYNIHPVWELQFSIKALVENLSILDDFFTYFTPVVWFAGWLILPIIFIISVYQFKEQKVKSLCLILSVLFIFGTLGINKVSDRIDSILLSSTRMYLGIPMIIGLAFLWHRSIYKWSEHRTKYLILVIAISVFLIKASILKPIVNYHTQKTNFVCVAVKRVRDIKCDCEKFIELSRKHGSELILFVPNWVMNVAEMEFYNYGCTLLEKDFPQTMLSSLERRTWVFQNEKLKIRNNILIIGLERNEQQIDHLRNHQILSYFPPIINVKNNVFPVDSVLKKLNYNYER